MSSRAAAFVRCLSGLTGCAILLVLLVGPVTPYFRFADRLRPYADGIFKQSGPVDVVFVGSSRAHASVVAKRLEPLLSDQLRRPVVVYDLAKPGRGSDFDYLLLQEVFKRSPIKLVVIEYSATPQGNNHYFFIQSATWKMIFDAAFVYENWLGHLASLIREKLKMFMTIATNNSLFRPPARPASAVASLDFTTPRGPTEHRLRGAIARGWVPTELHLGEPENIVQDAYIRKSIELAKTHGSKAVLLSIPGLYQKPLTPAQRMQLGSYFGVDVIGLDDNDLKHFSVHDYSDDRHHGWRALDVYLPLLARWLAPRLVPPVDRDNAS